MQAPISDSRQPPLRLSLGIWSLAASFYLFGFFHRVTPGVLTDELSQSFHLSHAGLGNLSAFYFYFYAAMQVPVGLLVDRIGPRAVLTAGCLLGGLGAALFGLAPNLAWAAAGRGLVGGSVAVGWVSLLVLIGRWFAPHRFATMSGLSLAVGTLGAVLAGIPLKVLADLYGWRTVMLASGAFSLVLGLLIWRFVRNSPQDRRYANFVSPAQLEEESIPLHIALLRIMNHAAVWLLFWVPSGVCGAFLTFTGLWGVPYLVTMYGFDIKMASSIVTLMLIAYAIGSLAFGAWSDSVGLRKTPYLTGASLTFLCFTGLGLFPGMSAALAILLLLLGALGSGVMGLGFVYVKESVPRSLAAAAVGFVNLGVMVGPLIQQPLLGAVLDHYSIEGVQGYSKAGMTTCMLILAVWVASAIAALAATRETHAQARYAD